MSNIVDRLRLANAPDGEYFPTAIELEAADEIERLNHIVAAREDMDVHPGEVIDQQRAEIESLTRELGMLRRAMEAGERRLMDAATRAGVTPMGCDTADHLADEIVHLRHVMTVRAAGCQCSDDDACLFVRQRDEALAKLAIITEISDRLNDAGLLTPDNGHSPLSSQARRRTEAPAQNGS